MSKQSNLRFYVSRHISRGRISWNEKCWDFIYGLLISILLALCGSCLGCQATAEANSLESEPQWRNLAPGLELAEAKVRPEEGETATAILFLRLDPDLWSLEPHHFAEEDLETPPSLDSWVERTRAPVVFNAGFYYEDLRHIGLLLRDGENLGTRLHPKWKGLLVSDPRKAGLPPMDILDLIEQDFDSESPSYGVAIQSLMILKNGDKRVRSTEKLASRTAAARDEKGRIYIVWTEGAFSLWRLADILHKSGLGIERAMTLDGGREAQVAIKIADRDLRRYGVTSLGALGLLQGPIPLPAVIAVRPRSHD